MHPRFCHLISAATLACALSSPARAADETTAPPSPADVRDVAQDATAAKSVLVLAVRPIGISEDLAASLSLELERQVLASSRLNVTTQRDLQAVLSLEQSRAMVGCTSDVACLSEVASAAKADLLLASSLGAVGNQLVLNLMLIDARKGSVREQKSQTFGAAAEIPAALAGMLGDLFGDTAAAPKFRLPAGVKLSFAVFDLVPSGLGKEIADNLTQILSAELRRYEGATVISRDDINAMLQLEKQKDMTGCQDDTSCLAEIGGALGVDKLVVGQVGKLAESYVIGLRLIDARAALVENRITESFRGEEEQLIRAMHHASRRLLGLEPQATGKLVVSASVPEVEISLNSERQGVLPMPPIENLTPGRHLLRVSKEGFFDWQSDVYIDPLDTTAVWAVLSEQPQKWYQKWWVWALGGTALAAATAATLYLVLRDPPAGEGTVALPGVQP